MKKQKTQYLGEFQWDEQGRLMQKAKAMIDFDSHYGETWIGVMVDDEPVRRADGVCAQTQKKLTEAVVRDCWNQTVPSLPSIKLVPTERLKHATARCGGDLGVLREYFAKIEASDFITGRATGLANPWATFDWAMKPANHTKVLEGNYDNREKSGAQVARRF